MDIGSGKDLNDYTYGEKKIKYHLIDIAEPGEEYSVFRFQSDFLAAWKTITTHQALPILCGGTGLYLESVVNGYRMIKVPENIELRAQLELQSMEELAMLLKSFRRPHSTTDTCNRDRIIRAIEIEQFHHLHPELHAGMPDIRSLICGIRLERDEIRRRITMRLRTRLEEGMIEEVSGLLNKGIKSEALINYGLEYKYVTRYLEGQLSFDEMFTLLNTAIHQFAKRQMTWFRRMERNGCQIHWIDGLLDEQEKISLILEMLKQQSITQS
jgi:tRNA dimethylallyltransferase